MRSGVYIRSAIIRDNTVHMYFKDGSNEYPDKADIHHCHIRS